MKSNDKRERGAALINVMLIVLLAVAIGLPLLYLVITNFMFRMFDNNLRSISYKNEMGMDNVYAVIQEIVIDQTTDARDRARNDVDNQVKSEQDAYRAWTSDGRYLKEAGEDGVLGTDDDTISGDDDIDKLKKYMIEYGVINAEEGDFAYLDSADGSVIHEKVKEAYNNYFKIYYKNNMDTREGTFEEKLKNKAENNYSMKKLEDFNEGANQEQYALGTSEYKTYAAGGDDSTFTSINAQVRYRGKSETTNRFINSDVSATFTIGVPDFDSASSITQTTVKFSNPLLDKTMIVGNAIDIAKGKTLSIIGNSTISGEGIEEGEYAVNVAESGGININGRLAVNGDINLAGGKSSAKNILAATGDILCNEIKISGEYTDTNINGTLYIADDMEFNKENTNMVVGTFMGFNDDPLDPNRRSAILFNDKAASLDKIRLEIVDSIYIAGTAILDTLNYKTGESTAVNGNYRAYQGMINDNILDYSDPYYSYRGSNAFFGSYGGVSMFKDFVGNTEYDPDTGEISEKHKTNYFLLSYSLRNTANAFFTSMPNVFNSPKIIVPNEGWKYSVGAYYDSNSSEWKSPIGVADDAALVNAAKDYDKHTKYFGYGEGNIYRKENPTVIGTNGWIDSNKLIAAANAKDEFGNKKYDTFDGSDDVVLVSKGNITLTREINGRKGIIIAAGDIIINGDIAFKGSVICGGKLIVNGNFTLENDAVAVNKIIDSAVSADNRELFNIFQDDGSGNMYTYSTIDTKIASLNMNELIKISNWTKSKFNI